MIQKRRKPNYFLWGNDLQSFLGVNLFKISLRPYVPKIYLHPKNTKAIFKELYLCN